MQTNKDNNQQCDSLQQAQEANNKINMLEGIDNRPIAGAKHLILGASRCETHIQNYIKENPDVLVVCLCQNPLISPIEYDVCYWEGDFNSRHIWDELLLNFGEESFTRIIFDSSTSKFMESNFWTTEIRAVIKLLANQGQLYFDSYHTGIISYSKTFADDLATAGQTAGILALLPLTTDNTAINIMASLHDMSTNVFSKIENEVTQKTEFYLYLAALNQSKYGNYKLASDPYPIKNTTYPIAKYLVFVKSGHPSYT